MSVPLVDFPGAPRLENGLRLRRLLATEGRVAFWECTCVADGTRRVAQLGEGTLASGFFEHAPGMGLSGRVEVLLEEWLPLPGDTLVEGEELLVAQLAAMFAGAADTGDPLAEQPEPVAPEERVALAARIFLADGEWHRCGESGGPVVGALLSALGPGDPMEVARLFANGIPKDIASQLVRAWATHLAGERHVLDRRTRRDVVAHVASQLLAIASRLWRAMPPPEAMVEGVQSAGGRVRLATGEIVFGGGRLEVRPVRTAIRLLVETVEGEALRRWLVAMSTLRVERELLRRR